MAICSCPVDDLKNELTDQQGTPRFIEDTTYVCNTVHQLKLAKAFDVLDKIELSYKHGVRAFQTIESLVKLRKEQGLDYSPLLAPFYFKLADYIATFVELNTDEFGNVKPLNFEDSEEQESNDETSE